LPGVIFDKLEDPEGLAKSLTSERNVSSSGKSDFGSEQTLLFTRHRMTRRGDAVCKRRWPIKKGNGTKSRGGIEALKQWALKVIIHPFLISKS